MERWKGVLITVVISLEKVPDRLRGELSRWMIEVTTGVFVADLSATVRDLLWKKCESKLEQGRCALMYRTNNEQGFTLKLSGDFNRRISELDGLQFIAVQNARWHESLESEPRIVSPVRGSRAKRRTKTR
jgi:CRISPR-associated protein Cas2